MSFDGFFKPPGVSTGDNTTRSTAASYNRSSGRIQSSDPLIQIGPALQSQSDGLVVGSASTLDHEVATLEALRRSQAQLLKNSSKFSESPSPEARYLYAMTETLLEDEIYQREKTVNNYFTAKFEPDQKKPPQAMI